MRMALLIPFALLALASCSDQRQQLGQALSGKPPMIAGSLEGEWQIEDLNGGGSVARGELMFDPGDQGTSRISGTAGCNRFSGHWKQDGATLQLGPMAATRMACPPPAMEIEQRVLALLEAATSVTYTADGAAILATPDGRKLTLRKPAQP